MGFIFRWIIFKIYEWKCVKYTNSLPNKKEQFQRNGYIVFEED